MNTTDKMRNMASVYLSCGGKMLMLYRQGSRIVNDLWIASAGGHFEENELNEPRTCVLRELYEELSLTEDSLDCLHLRYITLRNCKGEVRQNFYFFAELKPAFADGLTSNEGELRWFDPSELSALDMPYSAKFMIEHYLSVGRHTDILYGGVSDGAGMIFTELREG